MSNSTFSPTRILGERDTPQIFLEIGGKPLPPELVNQILSFEITFELGKLPDAKWEFMNVNFLASDHHLLTIGQTIRYAWGFEGDMSPWVEDKITEVGGLFPFWIKSFHEEGKGKGRGHKTKKSKVHKGKIHEVARKIATNLGLHADVEEIDLPLTSFSQHHETDMEFLKRWAQAMGLEFRVTTHPAGITLKRPGHSEAPKREFTYAQDPNTGNAIGDIIKFDPREGTAGQRGKTELHGVDPHKKTAYVAKADEGHTGAKHGSVSHSVAVDAETGHERDVATSSGEPAAGHTAASPHHNPAVAKAHAAGHTAANEKKQTEGALQTVGYWDVQDGDVVLLSGLGKRYSGNWSVKKATHKIDGSGYMLDTDVYRSAAGGVQSHQGKTHKTKAAVNAHTEAKPKGKGNLKAMLPVSGESGRDGAVVYK